MFFCIFPVNQKCEADEDDSQQAFDDYRVSMKYYDAPFLVIQKILLNADRVSSFVLENGMVFSSDRKTLVHIPEAESVVIPSGIEAIGAV